MLSFRALGPLEICCDGITHRVTGSFRITLLGALLFSTSPIPPRVLSEELWGSGGSGHNQNSLHAHISRMRQMLRELEPDRPESRIVYSPDSGYSLSTRDEDVDFRVFATEVECLAHDNGLCGKEPEIVRRLRSVLAAWRGPLLGGIVGGPICQGAAAHYTGLRLRCLERLFEAELACGNHAGIIPELSAFVETYTPSVVRSSAYPSWLIVTGAPKRIPCIGRLVSP